MVSNAKQWKTSKKNSKAPVELEVPSGNVCLVRRPGPEAFVTQGMIPNSLMTLVMPLLEDARKAGAKGDTTEVPEEAFADLQNELMADPTKFMDMMTMMDDIVVQCVLEPKVLPEPASEDERDDELLYVDEVDLEDKMFIFQFCVGGTNDIDRFRQGTDAIVAAGQAGQEV